MSARRFPTVVSRVSGLSLDVKLGCRVLAKHPAVTVLAGLAIAFAIAICTATYEFVANVRSPTLPLEEGERIVAVQIVDAATARARWPRQRDFVAWREQVASIQQLGAFRDVKRNLVVPHGFVGPVSVAEMTASGFRVARVRPLLGRALVDQDEVPGAPSVVLIGYEVWQTQFHADPEVVGRTVRLGEEQATVVGVMPKGFAFPVRHSLWTPLRPTPTSRGADVDAGALVFGRLAPGASLERAQSELSTLWSRRPNDGTGDAAARRPSVVHYPHAFFDVAAASAYSINLSAALFLGLLCANVGLLLFVRLAAREEELSLRSALGASRRRIVVQLVVEALVLATLAAAVGLGGAALAVREGVRLYEEMGGGQLPFWVRRSLSPQSIAYAFGLTGLCALLSGVVPAMHATASGLAARLRDAGVGGTTMRLGRLWAATVVVQVALVVAFVPICIRLGLDTHRIRTADLGVDPSAYVVASVNMDGPPLAAPAEPPPAATARLQATYAALKARLKAEPGVTGVAFASALPGDGQGNHGSRAELGEGTADRRQIQVTRIDVDPDLFATLEMRIVAGRGWHSGDPRAEGRAVIVNQSFVRELLGGRSPVGEGIRYLPVRITWDGVAAPPQNPEPPYEIVGVVSDVRNSLDPETRSNAAVYHLAAPRARTLSDPGPGAFGRVVIRVRGDAAPLTARLRGIAAGVDASVRLDDVGTLHGLRRELLTQYSSMLRLATLAGALAALLAISGVYAVLSMTVTRRTREIGIRLSLGASRRHIVSALFARAAAQVGVGAVVGSGLLLVFDRLSPVRLIEVPLLAGSAVLLAGAAIAACALPMRRTLRVQPTEAITTR